LFIVKFPLYLGIIFAKASGFIAFKTIRGSSMANLGTNPPPTKICVPFSLKC
jgi:hypothetical protein